MKTHILNARPGINGNSASDFRKAAGMVYDAARAVELARKAVHENVMHGRNYQHETADFASTARDMDWSMQHEMRSMTRQLEEMAKAIVEVTQ